MLKKTLLFYKYLRLIDYQGIDDSNVTELFIEAGSFLKTLNALFNDLEYAVSVLENVSNILLFIFFFVLIISQ